MSQFLQGKRAEKEIHLDKNGTWRVWKISLTAARETIQADGGLELPAGREDILKNAFNAELASGNATLL